jgi:ribonuclease BN (tRNA processing enzyme)
MTGYGGRTSSVMFTKEKDGKKHYLFVDAGLGIIEAGKKIFPSLMDGTGGLEFTILFTHLHPDHTEGFTFFAPVFNPKVKMHLLGPACLKKNVGIVLQDKMAPPTYPIEYKDLKAERKHGVVVDGQTFYINDKGQPLTNLSKDSKAVFEIKAMQSYAPSHPQQGSIYYRVTDMETGRSVVCGWDIESRAGGDQRFIAFSKDADIMIHDTQYTEEEYNSDKMVVQGFGHSTYEMAIENAIKANCKKLITFHYGSNHTDDRLDDIINPLIQKYEGTLKIIPSKEKLEIAV